jgi:tetratricopeptide (TPR) repeat protein
VSNTLIPLDSLINSASYRRQNQFLAFDQASSFVKYLIEKYSKEKVREFYKEVSDLNVKESIGTHFAPFEKVKSDWLGFLANFQPQSGELLYQAKLKAGIRDYRASLTLYEEMLNVFVHQELYSQIANAYYLVGDYRQAADYYQRWVRTDSLSSQKRYVLGNMLWLDGQIASARQNYLKAVNLDSAFGPAYVKLAQLAFDSDENENCRNWLAKLGSLNLEPTDELDYRILKSKMEQIDNKKDSAAESGWKATMLGRDLVIQTPEEPLAYLLAGKAYLSADSLTQAEEYLKVAELLEDRAYYTGQVRLALGELHYRNKDSELARKYLQSVLETPSGYREKLAAKSLLTRF